MKQIDRFAELLRAGPVTPDDARQAGIRRPAKVVAQLRDRGHRIATIRPDGGAAVYVESRDAA